jgi:hypothetical protein
MTTNLYKKDVNSAITSLKIYLLNSNPDQLELTKQ